MTAVLITGTGGESSLGHKIAMDLVARKMISDRGDVGLYSEIDEVIGADISADERVQKFGYMQCFVDIRSYDNCCYLKSRLDVMEKKIDVLVNCAAIHDLHYLEDCDERIVANVLQTNVTGMFNMTKAFLPHLSMWEDGQVPPMVEIHGGEEVWETKGIAYENWLRTRPGVRPGGTVLNILSTAAHVPMTASFAYSASKAAELQGTQQLARELMNRHGITVFGISPNKLAGTGMSQEVDRRVCEVRGWTPEFAKEYSDKNILCGEETDPARLAEFIGFLLAHKHRHKYLAGTIIPYGYQR